MDLIERLLKMADTVPHCFFFYGLCRDDAIKAGRSYRKNTLLKGMIDAKTARLYNHKMYQNTYERAPFAVEANDSNNYIIGRVITFGDAHFDEKLIQMNKYFESNWRYSTNCKPVIVGVYLETDDAKTNVIMARTYIADTKMVRFDECTEIESNDWMRRNVLKSEIKTVRQNRIRSAKIGVRLSSSKSPKYFREWKENVTYKKGDIVAVEPEKNSNPRFLRFGDINMSEVTLWAMCINTHESNILNKPCTDDIFADLLINLSLFINMYLIQHVEGFNNELSTIIIKYCYQTNGVWWNGCYDRTTSQAICGNLVAGLISTELCKICAMQQLNITVEHESEPIKGAIICLNKTEGIMQRKYVINEEKESNNYKNKNIILRTNIDSQSEKHKIYNLLTRNFNESMEPLIKACIENKKVFIYDTNVEINIGDTNIWALYDNMYGKDEELLCALIWRYVHGKTEKVNSTRLMFETVFLSTYEHVRFNHYGKQMVNEIELYCIANGYDLMSVAAVPGHGEQFWASNGFQLEHCAAGLADDSDDKKENESARNEWLRNNMLVFDDTPLYAKYIGV